MQAYAASATTVLIRTTVAFNMYCKDSSGNNVNCTYSTGSGMSSPMASDPISLNAPGNTNPSTVAFTNAPIFRGSGSTLCPPGGPVGSANAIKFTVSYQTYTGSTYPGGSGVYVQ